MTSQTPNQAISVAGLTEYIQALLEQDPILRQVWVTGEVSSANHHRVGLFFTLQDPDNGASIRCVVWQGMMGKLSQQPQIGERVIILGSLRLYTQRGEYQLQVWQVLPDGVGLQALHFQQLKNRLQAEGLFAPERKRSLPVHPHTIGVVTSPTAAAWGDMQKTWRSRYPGLRVIFAPATVQGDTAPQSIVQAIQRIERDRRAEVLIVARGGGAVEELACFNDELVVRAIATCSIPVITGIGHERDESLADLAADVSVHTPTAAAELVVPALADLYRQHQHRIEQLIGAVDRVYSQQQMHLTKMRDRLNRIHPDKLIKQELKTLQWQRQRLLQIVSTQLKQRSQHLQMLRQKLTVLDPNAVLKRGYALVRNQNGDIIRTATDVEINEELILLLGEGKIKVRVEDYL